MKVHEIVSEGKKRNKKKKRSAALYGPGAYGMYGTNAGYSGDGGGGIGEDWKSALASAGVASAMALGGTGGMMAKQALTSPSSSTTPQPQITKQVDMPKGAATKPTVTAKPQVEKEPVVKSITNNPLEEVLRKTALKSGIKGTELAAFMAQCAHETMDFKRLTEFGGSLDFRKYDPKYAPKKAKALGNVKPGDGAKYKGRGFIQITGRYNYQKAGDAVGLNLLKNHELAEKPEVAAIIAVWFWQHRVQAHVNNFKDTSAVTKQINPGMRGLEQRKDNFNDYMQLATR
jgi:predicted chitinase